MENGIIIGEKLPTFAEWLRSEDKSAGTIEKYLRDVAAFAAWLGARELTKETGAEWREHLTAEAYAPVTVNSMLAAVNTYCVFSGLNIRVRFLKVQRKVFLPGLTLLLCVKVRKGAAAEAAALVRWAPVRVRNRGRGNFSCYT